MSLGLFFIVLFLATTFAEGGLLLCDTDRDCQDGFGCHERICQNCVKCGLLNRKGNNCVSDFKDCGVCLEGYEEILVTDFSAVVKPCRPIMKKVILRECEHNYNCPPNSYCSENSCIECFDCSLINRLESTENCTKVKEECGPCLNGYLDDPDENESDFDACVTNIYASNRDFLSDHEFRTLLLLCICWVVIFALMRMKLCFKLDESSSKSSLSLPIPSAPPLYILKNTELEERLEVQTPVVANFEKISILGAKVFKMPDAPYYNREGEDDYGITVPEHSGNNEISPPNSFDQPLSLTETQVDASAEEPLEMSVISDSSGYSSNLDVVDATQTQVSETPAKEEAQDVPENQNSQ